MQLPQSKNSLRTEVQRRRTFAIISHPDAGKTTLTEKFLLYGGAVRLAGSVTARKRERATTSDWMELERKRGISVSSTVLQFEYRGYLINLLDTPGHRDFSDDTYRVLTAVDAVIMVIDAGKGIEPQTLKLFEVCRLRGVPIFTFMNKLDRPSRDPLELLDELEEVLGIATYPMNWPLGAGVDFKGVWDRPTQSAYLFERTPGGAYRAPVVTGSLADARIRDRMDEVTHRRACEEIEILDAAGAAFSAADVAAARTTPVYFGSAINNFGIELLLDGFVENAISPAPRRCVSGQWIEPCDEQFSAFVFKIQANMDPLHRDRVAFMRVVSGVFQRDMVVTNPRVGKSMRLSNASKLFGSDRESIETAYPGDVVGIVGNGRIAIGDTLTEHPKRMYDEIPHFAPECFAYFHNNEPAEAKRFRKGLDQLLEEGVAQTFEIADAVQRIPLLGAAGPLQFDVMQFRLESEYGAQSRWELAPWSQARWLHPATPEGEMILSRNMQQARDGRGRRVLLFKDEWTRKYFEDRNPDVGLSFCPFDSTHPF